MAFRRSTVRSRSAPPFSFCNCKRKMPRRSCSVTALHEAQGRNCEAGRRSPLRFEQCPGMPAQPHANPERLRSTPSTVLPISSTSWLLRALVGCFPHGLVLLAHELVFERLTQCSNTSAWSRLPVFPVFQPRPSGTLSAPPRGTPFWSLGSSPALESGTATVFASRKILAVTMRGRSPALQSEGRRGSRYVHHADPIEASLFDMVTVT